MTAMKVIKTFKTAKMPKGSCVGGLNKAAKPNYKKAGTMGPRVTYNAQDSLQGRTCNLNRDTLGGYSKARSTKREGGWGERK